MVVVGLAATDRALATAQPLGPAHDRGAVQTTEVPPGTVSDDPESSAEDLDPSSRNGWVLWFVLGAGVAVVLAVAAIRRRSAGGSG